LSALAADDELLIESDAEVEKLAGGMKFTERPVWLAEEKKLIFSDISKNHQPADGIIFHASPDYRTSGKGGVVDC